MDLGMAVCAATVEIPNRILDSRGSRVAAGNMARIANSWHTHFQQLGIVGAVSFVTVGTIFHDRRVLIQEWAAPLCVAGQTVFVHRALDQLLGIRRSMRIMAAGASDFTLSIGHMG